MMQLPTLSKIILAYDDQLHHLNLEKKTFLDELFVDLQRSPMEGGERIQIILHPKSSITLKELTLEYSFSYQSIDQVLGNGWQSWSWTKEHAIDEEIKGQRSIGRSRLQYMGDDSFPEVQRGKGKLHSWTYSYIRRNQDYLLLGSLNERTAFTMIQHDTKSNTIRVNAQVAGYEMKHSFPILDFCILKGSESNVFDQYFAHQEQKRPISPPLVGWTSWYHYYTNISEEIILKNLEAVKTNPTQIQLVQIDDGYQTAVGDWLDIRPSFPNGMASVARQIQGQGLKAGLWLAPFICEQKSKLFSSRPDWLVKDEKGNPVKIGHNPLWSGWFYALDITLPAVREHLSGIFYTILQKWNFEFLKLDFLYAACAYPRKDFTRGQLMHQGMQFLREVMGNTPMLACGVPLGSAFGMADYCRIGADIHTKWEHPLLAFLRHRERVSTKVATDTVLYRRHLEGRAFRNDPDVVIFRKEKQDLSPTQQNTIGLLASLCSQTLFSSDDFSELTPEQLAEWDQTVSLLDSKIQLVWKKDGVDYIQFEQNGKSWMAYINRTKSNQTYFHKKKAFELLPYESIVLKG